MRIKKIKEIDLFQNDLNGSILPHFFLSNLQLYYFSVGNNLKLSRSLSYLPSNSSLRCLDIRGTNISGGLSSTYLKIMNAMLKLPALGFNISEIEVTGSLNLFFENKKIGELRSACFSPKYETVIGIAMINKPYFEVGQSFEINLIDKSNKNIHTGKICELPFI